MHRTDVEVKGSAVHGSGVYALRRFHKGDVVLRWDTSQRVAREEGASYAEANGVYLHPYDQESCIVVQSPERYVNHSCDNNTEVVDFSDVAIRDIAAGEEITSNYETDGAGLTFQCRCGSLHCRAAIGSKAG